MIDVISARKRILEIAVHGNLVPNTNDESPQESVSNNIETRAKLIMEKLTKEPKVKPMITEGTFDIPSSWIWVPLGDLCILLSRGKSPKYSDNEKYPVFAQKCNQPNGLALEKALFLDETTLEKWPEYFKLRDKDIVINSTGTGTVGRVGFYISEALSSKYPFIVPDSHVTVVRVGENIMPEFVFYALRSTSIQKIMFDQFRGSTNQKEFYIDSVYSIPIPLPPLAEQKRIVERVEEIFKLLDTIDEAQEKYTADAESLKAKLITAGIQGKLTEQLDSDGTAEELYQQIQAEKQRLIKEGKIKKEKPLPEIKSEEVPFEIPGSWKWVRLGDITTKITSGSTPPGGKKGNSYVPKGFCFFREQNIYNDGIHHDGMVFINEELLNTRRNSTVIANDILLNITGGSIGRCAIIPSDFDRGSINQHILIIRLVDTNMRYYIHQIICSPYVQKLIKSKAVGDKDGFSGGRCKNTLIPLPPLAEQKRIAEVLERVMGAVDRL